MGKTKYLYGASVQGIQSFIFQTNELKDIVGASELVEKICTEYFNKYAVNGKTVIQAAGNVKFIFNDKASCEKAVLEFSKEVLKAAPGVTISQAVVKYDTDFSSAVEELESKLRIQRNKPMKNQNFGLIAMERSRKTGFPVEYIIKDEYLDASTKAKRDAQNVISLCQKNFGNTTGANKIAFDIKDMTKHNDWIAIIHIDGNGLGQIVSKVGSDENKFSKFSADLDKATINSAAKAYSSISYLFTEDDRIPIRPVVLGGDDHTDRKSVV